MAADTENMITIKPWGRIEGKHANVIAHAHDVESVVVVEKWTSEFEIPPLK